MPWNYPAPALANLDFDGLAEIVVGNRVVKLALDNGVLAVDRVFAGTLRMGTQKHGDETGHHGPTICPADLTVDRRSSRRDRRVQQTRTTRIRVRR